MGAERERLHLLCCFPLFGFFASSKRPECSKFVSRRVDLLGSNRNLELQWFSRFVVELQLQPQV